MKTLLNSLVLFTKIGFWFLMIQLVSIVLGRVYEPLAFFSLPIGHLNPSLGNANPVLAGFEAVVLILAAIYIVIGLAQGARKLVRSLSVKR